ncbi:cytochrome P450 [Amylostereum chailletii]|nr:cytochrome P450 [Amylostereum chailletii]
MFLILATTFLFAVAVCHLIPLRRQTPLPPGPRPLPFVGNVFDISQTTPWKTFTKWGIEYGSVVAIKVFRAHFILINSPTHANEILGRGSSSSSSRPNLLMAKMSGFDGLVPLLAPSEQLRQTRKYMHMALGPDAMTKDAPALQRRALTFANRIVESPELLLSEDVAGGLERIIYGATEESESSAFTKLAEEAIDIFKSLADPTSGWMVDVFPVLQYLPSWMPGGSFHKKAKNFREGVVGRMLDEPFRVALERITAGTSEPCLVSRLIPGGIENTLDEHSLCLIRNAATSAYLGGIDTSVCVAATLFLVMMLYPEAQARAQLEIDAVTKQARLPTLEDREALPFIDCILKEILRWAPPAPLVFPHIQDCDAVFDGQLIPSGSTILVNTWGICRDSKLYPDPDQFKPERFLDTSLLDPQSFTFGFGRRSCPGTHLVDRSTWITTATVLATLSVSCPVDPVTKEEKRPVPAFTEEPLRQPLPFECRIEARVPALLVKQ